MELLFKINIDGTEQVARSTADIERALKQINDQIDKNKKDGLSADKALSQSKKQLTSILRKDINAANRAQNNLFQATRTDGVGAYKRLSAELTVNRTRLKDLLALQIRNKSITKEQRIEIDSLTKSVSKQDGQLKKLDATTGQHQRSVGNYPKALSGVGTKLLAAFGFAGGVNLVSKVITQTIDDIKRLSVEAKGIEFAFNNTGEAGAKAFDDIKKSTRGLLSDLDIKKSIVEFDNFNISQKEAGTLFEFLSVRAAQTGKSIDSLRDSLVEGLSKQSKLRIDNLGISTQQLNAELVRTPNFVQAVANIAKTEIAEAGAVLDDAANSQSRYNAAYENFVLALSNDDSVTSFVNTLINAKTAALELITPTQTLSNEYEKEQGQLNVLVQRITDTNIAQEERQRLISQLNKDYPFFLANLDSERVTNAELSSQLSIVNEQYVNRIVLQTQQEKIEERANTLAGVKIKQIGAETSIRTQLDKVNRDLSLGLDLQNKSIDENIKSAKSQLQVLADQGGNINAARVALRKLNEAAVDRAVLSTQDIGITNQLNDLDKERKDIISQLGIDLDGLNNKMKTNTDVTTTAIASSIDRSDALEKEASALAKLLTFEEKIADQDRARLYAEDQKAVEDFTKALIGANAAELKLAGNGSPLANAGGPVRDRVAPQGSTSNVGDIDGFNEKLFQFTLEKEREIAQASIEITKLSELEKLKIQSDGLQNLLDNEELTAQQRLLLQEDFEKDKGEIIKQAATTQAQIEAEQTQKRIADQKAALGELQTGAVGLINTILDQQAARDTARFNKRIRETELEYDAKIEAAEGNKDLQESLEREFQVEKRKIEEEAFEKKKKNDITQTIINGAVAVVRAFSDLGPIAGAVAAAFVAAQTALQISAISGQEFAERGLLIDGDNSKGDHIAKGPSHAQGGIDGIFNGRRVNYEGGEAVYKDEFGGTAIINKKSTRQFAPELNSIRNKSFSGKRAYLSAINSHNNNGVRFTKPNRFNRIVAAEGALIGPIQQTPNQIIKNELTVNTRIMPEDIQSMKEANRDAFFEAAQEIINAQLNDAALQKITQA